MKRKMAMALAAVLVAGSLPVTVSAATFTDINEVSWASSTIQAVSDKGLINGYEDGIHTKSLHGASLLWLMVCPHRS